MAPSEKDIVAQETTEDLSKDALNKTPGDIPSSTPAHTKSTKVTEDLIDDVLDRTPGEVKGKSAKAAEEVADRIIKDALEDGEEKVVGSNAIKEALGELTPKVKGRIGIGILAGAALIGITAYGLTSRSKAKKRKGRDGISLNSQASQMHYYS